MAQSLLCGSRHSRRVHRLGRNQLRHALRSHTSLLGYQRVGLVFPWLSNVDFECVVEYLHGPVDRHVTDTRNHGTAASEEAKNRLEPDIHLGILVRLIPLFPFRVIGPSPTSPYTSPSLLAHVNI